MPVRKTERRPHEEHRSVWPPHLVTRWAASRSVCPQGNAAEGASNQELENRRRHHQRGAGFILEALDCRGGGDGSISWTCVPWVKMITKIFPGRNKDCNLLGRITG